MDIMLDHRLEREGHDNRARCHIHRCPLCLPPLGPGLVSWSPWLPPLFLPLSPPGLATVLCFLPQQHQPWQCLQGVQDDMRHHQIYVTFFYAFLVWGSTMHPAGLTSMVPGHAVPFALWERVQSSISQTYVHASPLLVIEEICSF